jgi:hypothetical protein
MFLIYFNYYNHSIIYIIYSIIYIIYIYFNINQKILNILILIKNIKYFKLDYYIKKLIFLKHFNILITIDKFTI